MASNSHHEDAARERFERVRARRHRAAREGRHLPSVREILGGSPWYADDVTQDLRTWAERVLGRLHTESDHDQRVLNAVQAAQHAPSTEALIETASAFRGILDAKEYTGPDALEAMWRADLYAATLGDTNACVRTAQTAIRYAGNMDAPRAEVAALIEAALGWMSTAPDARPVRWRGGDINGAADMRRLVERRGDGLMTALLRYHDDQAARITGSVPLVDLAARERRGSMRRVLDVDLDLDEIHETAAAERCLTVPEGIVVIPEVGGMTTKDGRAITADWREFVGARLPLVALDSARLPEIRRILHAEFPHAVEVADAIVSDLANRASVRMRPTVLIGAPGSGKSTFAIRLLEILGVQHQVMPCGGIADAAFAGAARQWSSGRPSVPLDLVRHWRTASPGIVLDEIEKVGTGKHNGNLLDSLLGMLEPRTAKAWRDPYIDAPVDLSAVVWMGTANSLDGVPAVLRDRCRIIRFPSPSPEHLEALTSILLPAIAADQGRHVAWAQPLDGMERGAILSAWPGGSLRVLRRLLEVVLAARERTLPRA